MHERWGAARLSLQLSAPCVAWCHFRRRISCAQSPDDATSIHIARAQTRRCRQGGDKQHAAHRWRGDVETYSHILLRDGWDALQPNWSGIPLPDVRRFTLAAPIGWYRLRGAAQQCLARQDLRQGTKMFRYHEPDRSCATYLGQLRAT
jgi:hypothetical protein